MVSVFSDVDSYVMYNPNSLENRQKYNKELEYTTQELKLINKRFYNITYEYYKITFPDGRETRTVDTIHRRIG